MKAFRYIQNHYHPLNPHRAKNVTFAVHTDAMSNQSLAERPEPVSNPSSSHEWRSRAFPKLIKLSHLLKGLDLINGRLVNAHTKLVVNDEFLLQSMRTFKSIAASFVMQNLHTCVNKPIYSEHFGINSLKITCDILRVSAQQRKLVRLAICPQVTHHRIWTGALIEILNQLENKLSVNKGSNMGQQIVVNCLKFLDDVMSYDPDSASWMRVAPKKDAEAPPSATWADLLEMVNDLITCLKNEHEFVFYVMKLEIMKEGLSQIKDVLVDKNLGYKEALHQQSLVHKKLSKSLGHSSRCLFTLLSYYLYGSIEDIEVDICCWVSEDSFCLCVGKIMTSDEGEMLMDVVKQLNRAIGVVKFVHEMAEMKEILEVQGHVWCIGLKSRSFAYRGHEFFIHGISL